MSNNSSQIVSEFLHAFMSGETERASKMVREDFVFRAPLIEGHSDKAAYFSGAANKAKHIRAFRILRQWADNNEVSTFYELDIETSVGSATMAISEWHTVVSGQIASTFMVFDSNAKAARLLGNALGAHH